MIHAEPDAKLPVSMSKVRQRFLSIAAWVCTFLGVALAAMWLHSQWYYTAVSLENVHYSPTFSQSGTAGTIESARGVVTISYRDWTSVWPAGIQLKNLPSLAQFRAVQAQSGYRWKVVHTRVDTAYQPEGFFGFSYKTDPNDYQVSVPIFPLSILLFLPAVLRVRRWRKARAIARIGLCRGCGYDLRASPERCPECGTPIPPVVPPGAPLWLRTIRHSRARLYGCMAIAAVSLYLAYGAIYELVRLHVLYTVGYNYRDNKGLAIAEQGCRGAFWLALGATALLFSVNATLSRFTNKALTAVPAPAATH